MSEWDKIKGFEAWTAKLRELLTAAQKVSASNDLQERIDLSQRFTDFVVNSEADDGDVHALDDIAKKASVDLLLAGINERLASMACRSSDLAGLSKALCAQAGKNETAAASIRLDRLHNTASALTDAVRSVNELRAVLKAGEDDQLLGKLDKLVDSLQSVRTAVEG
jgi:hypothetical protein